MTALAIATLLRPVVVRGLLERIDPHHALRLLTGSLALLAGAGTASLVLLTAAAAAQLPLVAAVGELSPARLAQRQPSALPIGALAAVILLVVATRLVTTAVRLLRRYRRVLRHDLPAAEGDRLIVLPDPVPYAVASPTLGRRRPGRVIASTAMLDALTPEQSRALIAHEEAHIDGHHHVHLGVAALAVALNPLLSPLQSALVYAVERSADEAAARAVGDRAVAAHAVGRAALAARDATPPRGSSASHAAGLLLAVTTGPVPKRVGALMTRPPSGAGAGAVLANVLLVIGCAAFAAAMYAGLDLHRLFEFAELH